MIDEKSVSAELQLAVARRRAGLCIHCGRRNDEPDDGYLGGTCSSCLKRLAREFARLCWFDVEEAE